MTRMTQWQPPRDAHAAGPNTCEFGTLRDKGDFAGGHAGRMWRWGRCPEHLGGSQAVTRVSLRAGETGGPESGGMKVRS